jgi:glycolate oxidase FAD binding subunit
MPAADGPASEDELKEAVAAALVSAIPLEVVGAGTKRGFGRPINPANTVTTRALTGITLYEPEELVMSAAAGTPLAEIEAALAAQHQMLAFEPPDYGPLYGADACGGTIGGVFACNLAGPRRFKAGAARDHILGVRAVSGRAEVFKAGGRVVKNVTGYDLGKLLTGSFGTLAVMSEITFKVLPAPETARTILLHRLDDAAAALEAMTKALGSPNEVSGAAHIPARNITALRVEGFGPSVAARVEALKSLLGGDITEDDGAMLWRDLRDLSGFGAGRCLWRLSLPPAAAAKTVAAIAREADVESLYDWGGARVFLAVPEVNDASAAVVRREAAAAGGHATLMRAPDGMRASIGVFPPQAEALAALTRRVKEGFDPHRILNPGRMYEGV